MIFVGGLERCPPGEVSAWRLVLRRLVRRRDVPRRLVFWRGVLRRQRPKYQLEECPLEACPPGGVSAWRRVLLEACPTGGLSAGEMTANLLIHLNIKALFLQPGPYGSVIYATLFHL